MTRFVWLVVVLAACGSGRTFVEPALQANVELGPSRATLTWRKGINVTSTLIVRSLSMAEPVAPVDVNVGDTVGQGVALAYTEDETYVDRDLPDVCGPFIWHLWTRNSQGTFAAEATTVRSQVGAHTLAPVDEVSGLSSVFEGNDVRVSWKPPEAGSAFEQVTVVRKVGAPPQSVTDGVVIYSGPSSSVREPITNLSASEVTHYAVFNCNTCGRCGSTAPSTGVSAPLDGGAGVTITSLTATLSPDGTTVELAWATSAPRVIILRRLNGRPASPTDVNATVVFDGPGTSTTERLSNLLPALPLEARQYTYAAWGCVGGTCSTTPANVTFSATLKQALRGGGYTLFFQHGTASTCVDQLALGTASTTTTPNWWKRCDEQCTTATAAQLTTSRAAQELTPVRVAFADGGVPVSRVISSEFCRAIRTAEGFSLGVTTIEQVQQLTYFVWDEANRCRDTKALLNEAPAPGTNVVYVGHPSPSGTCSPFDALNPAEVAIFKPMVGAPAAFVSRVRPDQWATLQ